MSDCDKDCAESGHNPTGIPVDEPKVEEAGEPGVLFQHVIITLADGRRGVFYGPALIKEIEMKLGTVPRLVNIDFDPPRAISVPVTKEESKDADTKAIEPVAEQPAVESSGSVEAAS